MCAGIVIVSYQGLRWIPRCLGSCRVHAPGTPVYVVDNASSDGSADYVRAAFPEVRLLRQTSNLGFAAGNNVGLTAALQDHLDAVMLLNQDAELTEGCLGGLLGYLEQHADVAAVQPAILLPEGTVNSLGNSFHYLGFGEAGGNGLTLEAASRVLPWVRGAGEPPYLSGAAVLLRAEALKQVGLFDEELFLYHEDLELCLRLRLAGWHLAVLLNVTVTHHYEQSRSVRQVYYMERNRFLVWLSYFKPATLALFFIPWLISEAGLLVTSLMGGWWRARVRACWYLMRPSTWRTIRKRRQKLNSFRQCSDRYLLQFASSAIDYHEGVTSAVTKYVFNPLSTLMWRVLWPFIRW